MVISWPGHIKDAGATSSQYLHIIDVFPTILEAAQFPPRVRQRRRAAGRRRRQLPRRADRPAAPERRTRQYFEMHGNRAIYSDGWVAAQRSGAAAVRRRRDEAPPAWELYDLEHDYSEAHDVAGTDPAKLAS